MSLRTAFSLSKMYFLKLFVVLISITLSLQASDDSYLPPPTNVSLVFIATRVGSGYRTPGKFFKNDKTQEKWGWAGVNALTNVGKEQAVGLGEFLRKRYSEQISSVYSPAQFKAFSSSAERLQEILLCVLAGLYPAKDQALFKKDLNWQPVPIEINDPLLRMNNVKCPTYTAAYKAIGEDTLNESKKWLKSKSDVVQYIARNAGFNETLNDMADAADNLQAMILSNSQLPSWIEKPSLKGYSKDALIKEILTFTEAHQIQCSQSPECAKSVAGLWLDHIIELMNKRKNGTLPDRKAMLYSGQTETVMSLMTLMKVNNTKVTPSTGFILEFTNNPPAVRVFSHVADKEKPSVRHVELLELPYCSDKEWCPFETFTNNVKAGAFQDLQEFCKLPKCNKF